jgi:hypothetical protein
VFYLTLFGEGFKAKVLLLITHVTRQDIFASREPTRGEAAKNAKKKFYIDEHDQQGKRPIQNPVYPVYRCKIKSTFALLQSLFPFSRSSRLPPRVGSREIIHS